MSALRDLQRCLKDRKAAAHRFSAEYNGAQKRESLCTFVQPEILPGLIADEVASPAVGNFMSHYIHLRIRTVGNLRTAHICLWKEQNHLHLHQEGGGGVGRASLTPFLGNKRTCCFAIPSLKI